ncbi:MAG: hypothetical protein ACM3QT_00075 [Syntrophothermus sp.]
METTHFDVMAICVLSVALVAAITPCPLTARAAVMASVPTRLIGLSCMKRRPRWSSS